MSFSTFSGPIRSGTVREGAGRNTGLAILAQSYDTGDLTGTAVGNVDVLAFYLPRGSQIIDITVDQDVAATAGSIRIAVGTATLTAGAAVITVSYVQRADNGAQNPTSA